MARVGVFGGSFNPVHEGHIQFLQQIQAKLNLDEILIVVCKSAVHKSVNLVDKMHRLEMCKKAVKNLTYVKVSQIEFEIDKNGYSVYTLQKIKQQTLNSELFLIVGPDSFLKIYSWHKFRQILGLARVVSGYFTDDEHREMKQLMVKFDFEALLIKINLVQCHSTLIRIRLAQGLSCSSFLNSDVQAYILDNKLYCEKNALFKECENACKNLLSAKRFNHCRLVSQMAGKLAVIYDENKMLAEVAGILHDIVKEHSPVKLLKILNSGGIKFSDLNLVEQVNPKLWHAPAGAIYCKKVLGVENEQILSAIECHTTTKAYMTNFEKIIFIADNVSADRKSTMARIERKLARRSLDEALLFHLKVYLGNSFKKNMAIHVNAVNCFNQLIVEKSELKKSGVIIK